MTFDEYAKLPKAERLKHLIDHLVTDLDDLDPTERRQIQALIDRKKAR